MKLLSDSLLNTLKKPLEIAKKPIESLKNRKPTVPNHKKTEHFFEEVHNIEDFINSIEKHGDKPALIWKESGVQRELSYSDLVKSVKEIAAGFAEEFGRNGTKIAVIGDSSPSWIMTYLAIIASGNTAVPMDKELAPEQISLFFDVADVRAVAYTKSFNDIFPSIIQGHKSLKLLIPFEPDESKLHKKAIPLSKFATAGKTAEDFVIDNDAERCCELLFTSGTTGTSKCVMLCQRNVFETVTSACASVDFCKEDVLVSVLPLHHTYELTCSLAAFNYGCTICINDSLRHVLRNFKEYRPTALVLVPLFVSTMYKKILSEANKSGKGAILSTASTVAHYLSFAGIDISDKVFKDVREAFGGRLEKIICGGAALDPKMIEIFDTFGISIYEGYGITECSPLVAVTPYFARKCGSVGPSVPCCEVKIEGSTTGENGSIIGEILVSGKNVMLGYMNNEAANNEVFTDDGWFRTGDMGYLDKDGYIYITGRKKSVIVLESGKNVFPEEIEEYLGAIDEIAESVVVGRVEEEKTKLTAVVFPNYEKYDKLSDSEITEQIQKKVTALNKKLPSFKQIHRLEFRKTEFEKTTTKKIKRHLV